MHIETLLETGCTPHHSDEPNSLLKQALVIDVDDPAAMVRHLREMPETDVAKKQQAVLAVQPQFAYLERGAPTAASAADLIAQAVCERWQRQAGVEVQLVDPQPIPASFLRQPAGIYDNPQLKVEATARLKAITRTTDYPGDLRERAPSGSEVKGAQAMGRLEHLQPRINNEDVAGDPARVVGERARQRRKRRKERPAISIAEHLGQDGRWQVGPKL